MITIIGAGPAGLSAAHHLDQDYTIYEQENEPGGLCRSFEVGGAIVDMGGHAFFSRHDDVHALLRELKVELVSRPRDARVYAYGRFVPYPFQHNLHRLPLDVVKECVAGAFRAEANASAEPAKDMDEWINRSFGAGIAKHFLTPYNEKLWGFPLTELAPHGTADRVVLADPDAVLDGALRHTRFTGYSNSTVGYPTQGGFSEIVRPLADRCSPYIVRGRVVGLDVLRRELIFDDGSRNLYQKVISTMPLPELVAGCTGLPQSCEDAASALKSSSLHLVNLVFPAGDRPVMQRVYSADPLVPFHKLVLNSNSSPALRAGARFAFQAEVSHTTHKRVSRDGLVEQTLDSLVSMGLVPAGEAPVAASLIDVRFAYPIHTSQTQRARLHLLEELAKHDVLCAGRFGEWLYINSDDALRRGKTRAYEIDGRI